MSAVHDAARELRWKANGNARLTARISSEAHDALALLVAHYGLDQRQVVQGLLLAAGAMLLRQDDTEITNTMRDHRMSRSEAIFFRQMLEAALPTKLTEQGESCAR